jgi:transaldolase
MKLFLDSADAALWHLPPGCPKVQGVTTNPTLALQAGLPVSLESYCALVQRAGYCGLSELMLQLPQPAVPEAAHWLARLQAAAAPCGVQLTIKLPCHPDWANILLAVQNAGLPTLLTGLSNPMQLLWAKERAATYVAPYVGRLQAAGRDVWALLKACVTVQNAGGPKLLAASIKSSDVLTQLIAIGAYAVTVRPEFAASLAIDPLTTAAMAQFNADTQASLIAQR